MNERRTPDAEPSQNPAGSSPATGGDLGPTSAIGRRLKAYYDDVAGEPVPDRFLSLLDALDTAEANPKAAKRS